MLDARLLLTGNRLAAWGAVLALAAGPAGCDLFEDIETEGGEDDPLAAACKDYCHALVYAWDDCLELWYGCGVTNEDEANAACTEVCVEAGAGFDDEEREAALECIDCYLEIYGETPSCWDVYLTDATPCVDDCQDVDASDLDEEWVDAVEDDCPMDEY
jgi:hypothetical protein